MHILPALAFPGPPLKFCIPDQPAGNYSAEDWTGLVSPVEVQSNPVVEIRLTEQAWLLKLTGLGSVRQGGLGKNRVIKGELACGLSG